MISADRWKPVDVAWLEQNAIIAAQDTKRSIALSAGPGAGKTEVLAQRADFLLRTGACRYPQRILAISFKVDAAANLRERVKRRCGYDLGSRLDSHTFHAFSKRLIDKFRVVLDGRFALDDDYSVGLVREHRRRLHFDDMVPFARRILQNSDVARNTIRQTYSYVFLDEFQDCTESQYGLIRDAFLGTGIPLTAVGDTNQRIMGWVPDALDAVFKMFADDFSAKTLMLYQNFRSQPRLRVMQNAMIKVMDPEAAVKSIDLKGDSSVIETFEYDDSLAEAEGIAQLIDEWVGSGIPPSEIGVLVANLVPQYAEYLMKELRRRKIQFRNENSEQDLASEPAAKLLVDYLKVVFGKREPDAYSRLMAILLGGDHDEDAALKARASLNRFLDATRADIRSRISAGSLSADYIFQATTLFLEEIGRDVVVGLSAEYENTERLEEVLSQTQQRIVEHISTPDSIEAAVARFADDGAVKIMTIHKSKGLEFDTVVMLGVENEAYFGDDISAVRSVFFVGISRAKRQLILTVANHRKRPTDYYKRWPEARTPEAEFLDYAKQV